MSNTYIHSAHELPAGSGVLIYGSGARGRAFLQQVADSGHAQALGFVDSYSSGECCGLPVHALKDLGEVLARPEYAGAVIVIASAFHRKIGKDLAALGIGEYAVFLDPGEGPPLVDVPVSELAAVLNQHRHPLRATLRTAPSEGDVPRSAPGRCLRCTSLSTVYFRPSGLTLCCWMPDLVEVAGPDAPDADKHGALALERLNAARVALTQALDAGRNPYCATCPDAYETTEQALPERWVGLHLDISTLCNLNCSYCIVKNTFRGVEYDFDALFEHMLAHDMLAENCIFDWGGAGEPTLYPGFGKRTAELLALGGRGLVYTNGLKFSPVIEEGSRGRLTIMCSMDAGTRETYAAVRGVDGFELVWANIRRYLAANPDNVTLKYIVTSQNAAPDEVRAFVACCAAAGVRKVCLSRDFYSEVTEAEQDALALLAGQCVAAGISYHCLGTAIPVAVSNTVQSASRAGEGEPCPAR